MYSCHVGLSVVTGTSTVFYKSQYVLKRFCMMSCMTGPDETTEAFRQNIGKFLVQLQVGTRKPPFHAVRITQPRVPRLSLLRRGRAWV